MSEEYTEVIVAGALIRGVLRQYFFINNIRFEEQKGFLDSAFRVWVTFEQSCNLDHLLESLKKETRTIKVRKSNFDIFQKRAARLNVTATLIKTGLRNKIVEVHGNGDVLDYLENKRGD